MNKRRQEYPTSDRPNKFSKQDMMSVVIILDKDHNNNDKKWKYLLNNYRFEFYDHLYPFRLATSTVFKMTGVNDCITFDEYASEIGELSSKLFGKYFVYDSFFRWYNFKPRTDIVIITGLKEGIPADDYAIDTLLQHGASVMYSPSCKEDEGKFLREFQESLRVRFYKVIPPFNHGHPKNNMKKKTI